MSESLIPYLLPAFPLLSFAMLAVVFASSMSHSLTVTRRSNDTVRVLAIVLTAFSYAAMMAVAIVGATTRQTFDLPFFYLLVSFLAYYLSITVLTFQQRRWHELLAGALLDVGSLALLLSVLSILLIAPYSPFYRIALSATAFLIWYADHLVRTALTARMLSRSEENELLDERQQEEQLRRTAVGDALWYLLKGYKSE